MPNSVTLIGLVFSPCILMDLHYWLVCAIVKPQVSSMQFWYILLPLCFIFFKIWIQVHHTRAKWKQLICDLHDPKCAIYPSSGTCTVNQYNLPSDSIDTLKATHRLQAKWPSCVLPSHENKFGIWYSLRSQPETEFGCGWERHYVWELVSSPTGPACQAEQGMLERNASLDVSGRNCHIKKQRLWDWCLRPPLVHLWCYVLVYHMH